MLTEKQLEMFGDRGAAVFQSAEQDIIADIARRVKKTGRFTETAELQAQALRAAGVSTQEIRKEVMKILNADDEYKKYVANNTKQYKRDVIHAIRQMEKDAAAEGNQIIADAGDMAFNKDLSAWHRAGVDLTKDDGIVKIMKEMSLSTNGTFKNLTKTMGFKGAYDFISVQNAYIKYLDKAVMKMSTGAYSFDAAVNDAVREMAQSGLRSVDYASGRTYQLDTAARMCVRTSCHQLSAKITERNCDITGTDLVEVSAHWGARPEHAEWQGKIYSRSGRNKNYPPFSETQYGAVNGLCGVNCRHTFYPFFEGISEPTKWDKEPEPKEYNGRTYKYYDMMQKQRQMERGIRATKREIEAQKAIGGNPDTLETQKRKQVAEYHRFSKEMGIRPKDNRLRVVKGSGDLTRTRTYKETKRGQELKSGALTMKNDPLGRKREAHAKRYYAEITNRKPYIVINKIAKNGNISKKSAENIYNHVFIERHKFIDGSTHMFDPDYDMAESFRRILDGKDIKPHDIVLLKHENLELNLMKKYNLVYEDAHDITIRKYDYQKALDEFLKEVEQ
jgi:BMFP domain-containing protein YqiC|nr:MAG TPA: minor capsid protein [Caudoviricetes sp.]